MELIILIAVVVAVLGYFLWRDRKYEESGDHPLDGATKQNEVPYKVEPPVLTTKVDGIGHETVEVAATVQEPAKKPKKPKKPAQPKKAPAKTTKPTNTQAKPKKAPKK
jgi:outer membrane biosynthesis protein TonB